MVYCIHSMRFEGFTERQNEILSQKYGIAKNVVKSQARISVRPAR